MSNINRREALKRTALIMGSALSASTIMGVLNGCTPDAQPNWVPVFFSKEQATLIMEVADIIIPKTDTPGAVELGIPKFIEKMISKVYKEKDSKTFMAGFEDFNKKCTAEMDEAFLGLGKEKKSEFVNKINDEISGMKDRKGVHEFFFKIKELTVLGYFTTEVGATQVLQYQAIPVEYKGCITLEEAGGKTWATS